MVQELSVHPVVTINTMRNSILMVLVDNIQLVGVKTVRIFALHNF